MRRIETIADACDFVRHWCGLKAWVPGPALRPDLPWPACYRVLNDRLGGAWAKKVPGLHVKTYPGGPGQSIFKIQDYIMPPDKLDFGKDIIPLVDENQGVFSFGFENTAGLDTTDTPKVYVKGDWFYGETALDRDAWCAVDVPLEDVLIFFLINNLVWQTTALSDGVDAPWEPTDPPLEFEHLWTHRFFENAVPFYATPNWDRLFVYGMGLEVCCP